MCLSPIDVPSFILFNFSALLNSFNISPINVPLPILFEFSSFLLISITSIKSILIFNNKIGRADELSYI